MDLYETASRSNGWQVREDLFGLVRRYEAHVKFNLTLALTVAAGVGLRIVFEKQLGQVFGAMLVWFSLLFGLAGLALLLLFVARGKVIELTRDSR